MKVFFSGSPVARSGTFAAPAPDLLALQSAQIGKYFVNVLEPSSFQYVMAFKEVMKVHSANVRNRTRLMAW